MKKISISSINGYVYFYVLITCLLVLPDISSFKTTVEGFGDDGSIGKAEAIFSTNLPFSMDAKIPNEMVSLIGKGLPESNGNSNIC